MSVCCAVRVLADNDRWIGCEFRFEDDLWNDHAVDHAALIRKYGEDHCRAFAEKEGVTLIPGTLTVTAPEPDLSLCPCPEHRR